ncbi:MAG: cytochrome P450 [Acidimicrobiales bacterium]
MSVTLTTFEDCRDGYRQKMFRQALYDAGGAVMKDSLLTLYGTDHRQRRRLENRLFRRDVFEHYETNILPPAVEEVLSEQVHGGDIVVMARRITLNLSATAAGVDRPLGTAQETAELYEHVVKLSEGATAIHTTRDPAELLAEVQASIDAWDRRFFTPSWERREALISGVEDGSVAEAELPPDVLTTLLVNRDELGMSREMILREVAFYLQAGTHSTTAAATHAVHEMLEWIDDHPDDRSRLISDPVYLQRFVHESMRLHPASPVALREALEPVTLKSGVEIGAGDMVQFDLMAANRDVTVFGADAAEFNPLRSIPEDVDPWGHSFGGGVHKCIGLELDGGVPPEPGSDKMILLGTVALIVHGALRRGARLDPDNMPTSDEATTRKWWGSHPVVFDPELAAG